MKHLDEMLRSEILHNLQDLNTQNINEYYKNVLLNIQEYIKKGYTLRYIKKYIKKNTHFEDLEELYTHLITQNYDNVKQEDTHFLKLTLEAIAGYTFYELIKHRKDDIKRNLIAVAHKIREAFKNNEDFDIDREVEKFDKKNETLLRTASKKAREYAYTKNDLISKDVRGWISIAVLDNRTSAICLALHNEFYSAKDYKTRLDIPNPPPRHFSCRSSLVTVFKGVDIRKYKGQNIDTFLKRNPDIAKEVMGKYKYGLWATGKAKVKTFIDVKGHRFYRNDEIIQRLGIKSEKRLNKAKEVGMK